MSDSFKYNPDDPYGSYNRKVEANHTRRTRQRAGQERITRTQEFNTGVNQSDDIYDDYGDYDYGRSHYATNSA